jgi:hypothetical protein
MERILVLTDYDIFAYLMVGLAAFAACDLALGTKLLYRDKWTFGPATVVVITAYITGQILSSPADWFFEELIVKAAMKEPAHHLVLSKDELEKINCDAPNPTDRGWIGRTLLVYYQPLGCQLQKSIRAKTDKNGQQLFFTAYPTAKKDSNAYERMMIFSRLYIFCRNMAFVALLAAIASIIRIGRSRYFRRDVRISTNVPRWLRNPYTQLAIFSAIAVGLFYRYLFFYRLYSVEVLIAYASAETAIKP